MIYKVKYRVAHSNYATKKYAFNIDDGNSVKFTKAFIMQEPSNEHNSTVLCMFEVQAGKAKVTKIANGYPVKVNGMQGEAFQLHPGDLLQVDEFHIEFLEIPHEEEVADNKTRFVNIATINQPSQAAQPAQQNKKPEAKKPEQQQQYKPELQQKPRDPYELKPANFESSSFDITGEINKIKEAAAMVGSEKPKLELAAEQHKPAPAKQANPYMFNARDNNDRFQLRPVHYAIGGAALVFALFGITSFIGGIFHAKPKAVEVVETPVAPIATPVTPAPAPVVTEEPSRTPSAMPTTVTPAPSAITPAPTTTMPTTAAPTAVPPNTLSMKETIPLAKPDRNNNNYVVDAMAAEMFFSAVRHDRLSVVKSMIEKKLISPDFTLDKDGSTALMHAAAYGRTEIVKYLLQQKVNVNAQDPNGTTALMWAVYKNHSAIVELLLKRHAKIDLLREDGQTAVDLAKNKRDKDIYNMLMAAKSEQSKRKLASSHKRKKSKKK